MSWFKRYAALTLARAVPQLFEWPCVRHTQVAVREGRDCKIIHAHFSMAAFGVRPDLVSPLLALIGESLSGHNH